jgi:glucosamine-6-phosphate deaminase
MHVFVHQDPKALGQAAGKQAAALIRTAIASHGSANIILATGTSQFETLQELIHASGIDWSKVSMFHLDEYIGLQETHPASFRKYLKERFISKVPKMKEVFLINGETIPSDECIRLSLAIENRPIDVALVGIGENGHLAFNDPPADFETEIPYIIVELDQACRNQQLGEGWFKKLHEVPMRAISMSIKQIMRSKHIICSVPDSRKAVAVNNTLTKKISNEFPASILREHGECYFHLDAASASQLPEDLRAGQI